MIPPVLVSYLFLLVLFSDFCSQSWISKLVLEKPSAAVFVYTWLFPCPNSKSTFSEEYVVSAQAFLVSADLHLFSPCFSSSLADDFCDLLDKWHTEGRYLSWAPWCTLEEPGSWRNSHVLGKRMRIPKWWSFKVTGLKCPSWSPAMRGTAPKGVRKLEVRELGKGFMQEALPQSVHFSCSVMSDSLQPHELQYARLPCPSSTPRAYSNTCLFT